MHRSMVTPPKVESMMNDCVIVNESIIFSDIIAYAIFIDILFYKIHTYKSASIYL